jgi:glycerol-3-phosphate acyltransferase PlsY
MSFLVFSLIAYLLGSIPTAVWIGKSWYGVDVREHGSKNAGATNTFRVLGKKPGIIVLCIDVFKGIVSTILPTFILLEADISADEIIKIQLVSALFAVLGHVFPVFAQFKGGKGVATSLGVVIGLQPTAASICLLIFLIVFIAFQYVSLGAILAAISFPISLKFFVHTSSNWLLSFSVVLAGLVLLAHKNNILRLLKGEESKMNLFKK